MTQATPRHRTDRTKNLVGFLVGEVRYAIDILRVREIINPLPIVDLPHAPSSVVGVADHRGAVVPILDLRKRFGLAAVEATRRTKWVIVDVGERSVGFVVDAVTDVFGANATEQREVPRIGGNDARGIVAVYSVEVESRGAERTTALVFVIDALRVAEPTLALDVGGVAIPNDQETGR